MTSSTLTDTITQIEAHAGQPTQLTLALRRIRDEQQAPIDPEAPMAAFSSAF